MDVNEVIVGLAPHRMEIMNRGEIVHWISKSTQTRIVLGSRTDVEGIEVLMTALMSENRNLRISILEFVRSRKDLKYLLKG